MQGLAGLHLLCIAHLRAFVHCDLDRTAELQRGLDLAVARRLVAGLRLGISALRANSMRHRSASARGLPWSLMLRPVDSAWGSQLTGKP